MTFRIASRLAALLAVALLIPACELSSANPNIVYYNPYPPRNVSAVSLSGSQVVPANPSIAIGDAMLSVSGTLDSISYTVNQTGLGTVTSVQVHVGSPGTNGPAIFTLATGPFANPLTGTLKPSDFIPAPAYGVPSFNKAIEKVVNGSAYLLISTVGSPNGELRGQFGGALLQAAQMTGTQVVAPIVTVNSGSLTLQPNDAQTSLALTLTFSGIPTASSAHIHLAAAGATGPSIFDLSTVAFSSPLTLTLTSADFIAAGGLTTFDQGLNAILSGQTYVDVHTGAFPGGELRCQIGPARCSAALTGGSVVPANSSTAVGTADLALNGRQTGFMVVLTHNAPSPTALGVHADVAGSNGPLIFNVSFAAGTSVAPVSVFIDGGMLIPAPGKSITTFGEAADAMLTGRTYFDVSTSGFPAGEIRGQILP